MTFRIPFIGAQPAKLVLVAALATGVLSTVAGRGTVAYFTTQVVSNSNAFTAGTLRMEIADVDEAHSVNPVSTSITFSNMKPGDVVYAPVELDNTGTLPVVYGFHYTTSTSGSQNLADGLSLGILGTGASGSGTRATVAGDSAHACSATNYATPGTIWPDTVRAAASMASAGETIVAVATPATGRALAANTGKDTLCLRIEFVDPGSANNTYNNSTNGATNTTVTFTFDGLVAANAVINNP